MTQKIFVFLLLIFSIHTLAGKANVHVFGKIDHAEGFTLKLKKSVDYVSSNKTIQSVLIDTTGNFDFKFEIEGPQIITLKCGFQVASFYVEPDKEYQLHIQYDPKNEHISYLADQRLFFDFVDIEKNDLNERISKFNALIDKFVVLNYDRIYKRSELTESAKIRITTILDSLYRKANVFNTTNDQYFFDFIHYKIAELKLSTKCLSYNDCLMEMYINREIQYDNYDFMLFFYAFFNEYLYNHCEEIEKERLRELARSSGLKALDNELKTLPYFQDDRFRELVLLVNLYGMFYNIDFRPTKILSYIREIKEYSKYPEHRVIAGNFIKRIRMLEPGSKLRDFSVDRLNGEQLNFSDFKGKYLLVNIWEVDCKDCYSVVDSLENIQNIYADKIKVIHVSNTRHKAKLQEYLNKNNFKSEFVTTLPDNDLYEYLRVRSLPASILLDEKGDIKLFPAVLREWGYKKTFGLIFKK